MLKKALFPLVLLTTPLLSLADTITVDRAALIGPYAMQQPYKTSDRNLRREEFKTGSFLAQNAEMVHTPATSDTICKDTALPALDGQPTLRVLRFTLTTQRFLPVRLSIRNLKNYRVYADGREASNDLKLKPGQTQIDLLCLTEGETADTFRVSVTGDSLAPLTVNAEGPRLFTQRDILFGSNYSGPTISPTGKYIAYSIYTKNIDGGASYVTYLRENNAALTLIRQYEGTASAQWLRGRDVLYTVRKDGDHRRLYAVDPTNGAETCLADDVPEEYFRLSPSGDYLIYSKTEKGPDDLPGTKRIIEPDDRMPGWRGRNVLYRYDIATRRTQRLTFGDQSVYLQDISADGRSLLLSFNTFKANTIPFDRQTVLRMDAYTGKVDTLLRDTIFIGSAIFSPDARQIVFQASPLAFGGIGNEVKPGQIPNAFDYRLYLYDITTRVTTPLLPHFAPSVSSFHWATGDGNIYFKATDGSDENLFRVNPGTRKVTKYELPLTYIQQYGISYASSHPQVIFCGQSGDRSRDLYIASLDKAKPKARRIGELSFDEWSKNLKLPTSHDWTFRATRGDTIHGFYFLPADFDATKQYPMIVYYYGGCTPTSKVLEGFWPLAALANMGYAVLVLNPSGAIGYGQEFAARHVNTWGDESGDDIIEGVKRFSQEHAFVDSKHIGCMGASYGGFMTQYLMTKTDIFACAISHAGISDITGYWGGGYWGYSYGQTAEYGSFPWSRPDLFVNHSPLYNADKIHTPLLLLHGTADTNVPTNQSQAMYTALRILNRPVAYVTFEGENHVITDFKKRQAWQEIINAWFAMWLQGDGTWWHSLYPGDCFDTTNK